MSSPRVFALPHLSEDAVAAFADGVLSASAAGRARRHCAECAECADAVRIQREAAMMLRTAQVPALPSGLLDRLAGLPMSTPLPPPRSGLPTMLGADGTPVFLAHGMHEARPGGAHPGGAHAGGAPDQSSSAEAARPAHRRGALPVTVLASAAAVVAAGTFGGHVSTLASSDRPIPAGAAQVAGALTGGPNAAGGQNALLRSPGSLIGTGAVLNTGVPVTGPVSTAGDPVKPTARTPLRAPVTVAPVHPRPHAPQAFQASEASQASQASGTAGTVPSVQAAVPPVQAVPAGLRPMPGEPTAIP